MTMKIPNHAIIKAHRDWGDWYREAEYNLMFFDDWLKERWGVDIQSHYKYHKPTWRYYPAEMIDKGKAALFMLKYYD